MPQEIQIPLAGKQRIAGDLKFTGEPGRLLQFLLIKSQAAS
jgi:hypothetical protein